MAARSGGQGASRATPARRRWASGLLTTALVATLLPAGQVGGGAPPAAAAAAGMDDRAGVPWAAITGMSGDETVVTPIAATANDDPPVAVQVSEGPATANGMIGVGDVVMFEGPQRGLWVSDGTQEGTFELDVLPDGEVTNLSRPADVTSAGGRLYFAVGPGGTGGTVSEPEVWISDGTEAGTRALTDRDALSLHDIRYVVAFEERVYVSARYRDEAGNPDGPYALLLLDDSSSGASDLDNGSQPTVFGGALYSGSSDGLSRIEPGGTRTLVWERDQDAGNGGVFDLTAGDDLLYFRVRYGATVEMYASDGTDTGTVRVTDDPLRLRDQQQVAGDRVYFTAGTASNRELWVADGEPASARRIWPADGQSGWSRQLLDDQVAVVGDRLVFETRLDGWWTTNGDPAQTVPLELADGQPLPGVRQASSSDSFAWLGGNGGLVRTDGTSTGTVRAAPQELSVLTNSETAAIGDVLIFRADLESGFQPRIWRIDGDAPSWPTGAELRAASVGSTFVALQWPAAAADDEVTGYRVLADGQPVARTDGDDTSVTLDGLDSGATITFEVQAIAGFGALSDPLTLELTFGEETEPGTAPLDVTAVPGAVELDWPALPEADSYRVYRAVGDGDFAELADGITVSAHTDEGPNAETTYRYEVSAVVNGSEQPHTQQAAVDTLPISIDAPTGAPGAFARGGFPDVATLGTELRVTVTGDPHRAATATVAYTDTDTDDQPQTTALTLTEETTGTYQGSFTLAEGVATVETVDAQLCDTAAMCAEASATLDLLNGAALEVDLDVPEGALDGGRLTVLSDTAGGDVATVDAEGKARVRRLLPAQDYELRVDDPDGRQVASATVDVQPGTVRRPGLDVTLYENIRVRVRYPDGAPVIDAAVVLEQNGERVRQWWADDAGELVRPVPEGSYELTVSDTRQGQRVERRAARSIEIERGDEGFMTLELPNLAEGTVTGTVTTAAGDPAPYAEMTVTQSVDRRRWTTRATADADGRYEATVLAGDMRVVATAGLSGVAEEATVAAGDTAVVDLTLPPETDYDFEIEVRTDYAGEGLSPPINLDFLFVSNLVYEVTVNGQRVAGTRHRLPGPEGEPIEVCVDGPRELTSDCTDVVFPDDGGPGLAQLVLTQRGAVEATIVDSTGRPAKFPKARLYRVDGDGRSHVQTQTFSGSDIRLSVPDAGAYELVVEIFDRATAPVRATVAEGQTVELGVLSLQAPGWFAPGSHITASPSSVVPGERVMWRTEYRNDGGTAENARLLFDVPVGTRLLEQGVTVDGDVRMLADLDKEGDAYALDLGDVAPGGTGVVRYVVEVEADATPGRIDAGVRMRYTADGSSVEEEFGSSAVTVSGVSIDAPRTTVVPDVPLSGRAPADALVEVFDGDVLIGATQATAGGYWTLNAELVNRGGNVRHRVRAHVAADDLRSGEAVVYHDPNAPRPVNVALEMVGRTHAFDPTEGVARFMFPHVPTAPLTVSAVFDQPGRVQDPHLRVGSVRVPMTFENNAFRARIDPLRSPGPMSIDYDTVAGPIDLDAVTAWMSDEAVIRNRLPRVLDDAEAGEPIFLDAAASPVSLQMGAHGEGTDEEIDGAGDDLSDFDLEDEPYDEGMRVQASATRMGLTIDTTLVARAVDYAPTASDLAYEARTGLPVYDRSTAWSLTATRFRFVGQMTVPFDELPAHGDPAAAVSEMITASLAADLGDDVAGELGTAQWDVGDLDIRPVATRRSIKVTYEVVSTGSTVSDAFSALSGADRYEELGDLLDDVMEACTSAMSRDLYRGQLDRIAKDAAAHQFVSAGVMVAGGAAAASTGGLLGIAAIGVTALVDRKLEQEVDDMIDNLKDRIAADPDCEEIDDDDRDRDRDDDHDDPLARPHWITLWDPAGYVFEAVESNRLQDATVTVLEGDPSDGAASDVESWSAWPAELFGQVNPQVTVADGRYAWDTPEGWWYTEAELDGYRSVSSEVMRVLPEHFDVHLNMVSLADPSVVSVDAWAAGEIDPAEAIVEFDHWMRVPGMVDRISVIDGDGDLVAGSVSPIGAEGHSTGRMSDASAELVAPHGELVAERFAFRPDEPWSAGDEFTVMVDGIAQGYNLKVLGDDEDVEVVVLSRPPSVAIDTALWVAEETDTGWLRGMDVAASIVDGGFGDVDAVTATLVDDALMALAEVAWTGEGSGASPTFTVPFDIDGWGSFDYAAEGRWEVRTPLRPAEHQRVVRAVVEVAFTDGRTVTAWTDAFGGDRASVVPPFVPTSSEDDTTNGDAPAPPPPTGTPAPGGPTPDGEDSEPVGFSDVVTGSTHADAILAIAGEGIALGYPDGTFRPEELVSREQMSSFLQRALDLPDGDPSAFADVEGTHAAAIGAIAREGITVGYPDGTFRPQEDVGRGHLAAMLARAGDLEASRSAGFTDTAGTTHETAIDAVAEAAIARGFDDGTFRPGDPVTRGQMASFLDRWLGYIG